MIIIKTKEGDCFINDHEMQLIDHYHKIKTVYIRSKDGKVKDEITHVESVRYISDAKAIDYTDEGSEVQKLKKENKEIVHVMNLITHGATGNGALALSKIEPHSLLPHYSFAPMNGAAVFDEKVTKDKLESLKLCFLCGHKVSEETLSALKELVRENGLTVVTTGRLLDAELYAKVNSDFCEIRDGAGVWIVVNDFRTPRLKTRVRGFLGPKDEIRLPFTTGTVRLKIGDKGNSIEVIE